MFFLSFNIRSRNTILVFSSIEKKYQVCLRHFLHNRSTPMTNSERIRVVLYSFWSRVLQFIPYCTELDQPVASQEISLLHFFSLSLSLFQVRPWGQQKVFYHLTSKPCIMGETKRTNEQKGNKKSGQIMTHFIKCTLNLIAFPAESGWVRLHV